MSPPDRLSFGIAAAVAAFSLIGCGELSGTDPLEDCSRPLDVVAYDGARLEVLEHRCGAAEGRGPAIAVWPPAADPGPWRRDLARWGVDGRTLWLVVEPLRDGVEVQDVSAVVEALAGRPGVDPGRVGVLVTGISAQALGYRIDRLEPAPAALALVTDDVPPSSVPPAGMGVEAFGHEDPGQAVRAASDWLGRQLEVD
jgi:hypothetical protein